MKNEVVSVLKEFVYDYELGYKVLTENMINKAKLAIKESRKLIHQYSDEDELGNRIWRDYDPNTYEPQSDTRIL